MFMQILTHTPTWVFVLFAVLVFFGAKQLVANRVSLTRMTIMPLAMTGLSLYGVVSVFGDSPLSLLTWLVGAAVAFTLNFRIPASAQVRYDTVNRSFQLPGSAVPLALFMGIFFTKYAVGISLGMQPSLAHSSSFALTLGGVYGLFSGTFLSRAAKLWRIAMAQPTIRSQSSALA